MHDHDQGLPQDLQRLRRGLTRRRLTLGALASLGGAASSVQAQATTCRVIPSTTAGPFPANGSGRFGGPALNALALSGIVRSDIRPNLAGVGGAAAGVPLELTLCLVNTAASCAALAGLAVYVWQCDREGRYSMYSPGARELNYLRGVQASDADGGVTFKTVFPGCYPGRMPHLHFEVYRSLDGATSATQRLKTSQLALPREACEQVYASASGYAGSMRSLAGISFASDGVFGDDVQAQLATVRGSVQGGWRATLTVGIAA